MYKPTHRRISRQESCNYSGNLYIDVVTLLIKNIALLAGIRNQNELLRGKALAGLQTLSNAYMIVEDEKIAAFGTMDELAYASSSFEQVIDASFQSILPCWCDSHTHLVFAKSREDEFVDKIRGLSYAEIAAKGGGILNSAARLQETSEDELFNLSWKRLQEAAQTGTGSIEIKSGYGLTVEGELKMLRVIKRLKQKSRLSVKATFLGAHAYPAAFRENHKGYLDAVVNEMLPVIAQEQLADFVDVFCETGFFSPQEMETICKAALAYGLKPKLHVNQLNSIGGIQKAVELKALSADHLETMTDEDVKCLADSSTIGTLLPTAAYFLRMPFQPARQLIDSGCAIALASDFNPGSSPGSDMNMVVSMSCIGMRMLPEEAINAATINGAYAMELQNETGSITIGKKADLIFTKPIPSLAYMPYSFSGKHIDKVMLRGEII